MALERDAHLTGVYLSQYFMPYVSYDGVAMLIAEVEEQAKAARERVESQCKDMASKAGVAFEWLAFDNRQVDTAIAHLRVADLLIAGQRDESDDETFVMEGFPETFLLGVGRPMLFVPYTYSHAASKRFDTVLVAWNGSREAAKAISDAFPILQAAKKVCVVVVEQKDFHYTADVPDVDIGLYLSRHGIKAEIVKSQSEHGRVGIGQCLLSKATDCGADLIVMGAYGHNRLTEWVLGCVTQTLLKEMTVPILMSH